MQVVRFLTGALAMGLLVLRVQAAGARPTPEALEFFEKKIRPVLAQQCYACHAGEKKQGGLQLDTKAAVLKGATAGPIIVPGKPEESSLIQALRYASATKMPPTGKLPEAVIADFEKWVTLGAPDPRDASVKPAATAWDAVVAERKKWWSLVPVRKPKLPTVKNTAWSPQPVDRFILAALEKAGLTPSPIADRRTLIRRATLVLTGLPPTPNEVEAFVHDRSPKAYEQLVDRLLASPQFGERWARHWMDVTRFGETHGYEWNYEVRDAWRYRDYLIRAFNQDVPYDQFVREHLAGDLIPPRWNQAEQLNESLIGTSFFRFGEAGHDNFREIGYDNVDNQIDTLSKAFQAATVSCARCHDHKLDAVSQRDYYALFGILMSSRPVIHTLDAAEANRATLAQLRALKAEVQREVGALWLSDARESARFLLAAHAARAKAPNAAALAQGLDPARVAKWQAMLDAKNLGLDEPAFVWNAVAGNAGDELSKTWNELAARYTRESKERAEFNAKHFTLFGDFAGGNPNGWRFDGQGLREGVARSGSFAVALEGDAAVSGVFPAGYFTHTLSDRLNGALVSPDAPKDKRFFSVQVVGGKQAQLRMVPDFRHLSDFNREIKQDRLGWMTMGQQADHYDDRVFFELVTKLDNQRIPERGAGKRAQLNLEDQRSYFGVTRAFVSDQGESPRDELSHLMPLFNGPTPTTRDEVAARFAAALTRTVETWLSAQATDDYARWLDWLVRYGLVRNQVKSSPQLGDLIAQYRATELQLEAPRVVAGMADVDRGADFPVLLRGDFRTLGDLAPRRFLEVLRKSESRPPRGSGRREFAEELVALDNPLTARVLVNRLWHWLFGTGLVRTVDDFGHMGELPSHPELLDHLAAEFVQEGWSLKRMLRTLLLTQAFQQSSPVAARAREQDPDNRLLSRFPARRLEGEGIRDSVLSVSGRLDRTLFGPSIDPYREKPSPDRKLYSGPLDGQGRRSLYTKITLMEAPRFLSVFNQPEAKLATGRREVTNVPAQALAMLNDPFILQQSEFWATRLLAESASTVAARLDRMFRTALGRAPSIEEAQQFEQLVSELATLHPTTAGGALTSLPVWKDVAHAVFNLKEFIYIP